jgi:hypothetical protein
MLRSSETLREMLRQESEGAPLALSNYLLEVANHPQATLFALELALHAFHNVCSMTSVPHNVRKYAIADLEWMCDPTKLSSGVIQCIEPHLFFAALHAAGLISDLNLGCSLAQSNGVVVLSLNPTPVLAAMPLDKWKAALTDAAKAAL